MDYDRMTDEYLLDDGTRVPGYFKHLSSDQIADLKSTNPKDQIAVTKLPLHLVSPLVEAYQAIAHYLGNVKYGAWNYRAAGIRYSVYYAALKRHMGAWWEGEEYDPVDGTPHLANALACINIIIEGKHAKNAVDDRPPSQAAELAKVRAEFERLADNILSRYGDRNPRHYTIGDSALLGAAPEVGDGGPVHEPETPPRKPASRPPETIEEFDIAKLLR